jgi:hypothetical protein
MALRRWYLIALAMALVVVTESLYRMSFCPSTTTVRVADAYAQRTKEVLRGEAKADAPPGGANLAIADGGLLPAQLCGAMTPDGGAGFRAAPFSHANITYRLLITAASVYNADAHGGARVDYLGLYAVDGASGCRRGSGGHCVLPAELRGVAVACEVGGAMRTGRFTFPYRDRPGGGRTDASSFVLECPLFAGEPAALLAPSSRTRLLLALEGGTKLDASICAAHVPIVHAAVVCTEPFFGPEYAGFWEGDPAYPRGAGLIASFLSHHLDVLGFGHVTISAFSSEFHERVRPYLGARVAYRGGWALSSALGRIGRVEALDYEELAETSCMWEHRLDARWVFRVHAADNFVMSLAGHRVGDALSQLDGSSVSGLELPITVPSTNANVSHAALGALNVLERWAARRPCPHETAQSGDGGAFCSAWRTVPAANPRHMSHVVVHTNEDGARTSEFGINLQGIAALNATGLFVSHVMGLTRSEHNKPELARHDALLSSYGQQLQAALSDGEAATAARRQSAAIFGELV